ncbi:CamS family sex pheromone protein [Alkalibacillus silvisoli]|uniref:CamS family sex pheromone protein n=1 Tax=Alkalibacillus silvisoli TaxID=392823 RepID=A0ABN0ZV77_9BACI
MKRLLGISTFLIIMLTTACAPTFETEEEVVQDPEDEQQPEEDQRMIVSPDSLDTNDYRMVLPYQPSAARGTITNQVANRYDIDEFEQGLTRLAKNAFDPEEYLFQEGQYLGSSLVYSIIDSLNPERPDDLQDELDEAVDEDNDDLIEEIEEEMEDYHEENPRVFSHVLEQNFLTREGDNRVELGGVAIGIALKSEYNFSVNFGPTLNEQIEMDDMLEVGYDVSDAILQRIREIEELQDVPVLVALYRENDRNAAVPGNFVAQSVVSPGDMLVSDWETVDENNVLFPSSEAEDDYYEDSEMVAEFTADVSEYFPNYIGVIGRGFYQGDELRSMSINIPVEFNGSQEVVGFTQHVASLMVEHFPPYFDLEVTIESPSKQESVLFRRAGDEEVTHHIYQ